MSTQIEEQSGSVRVAVLVVALEPGLLCRRAESAVVILGQRAQSLGVAVARGLLREGGGRLEVTDVMLARRIVHEAGDRERSAAHLALACCGAPGSHILFDWLDQGLAEAAPAANVARHASLHTSASRSADGLASSTLTAQERNVARLAATGARTTEIASAVFISPRTVEHHLTRIYRKLGVRSKAELAFALRAG